MRARITIYAFIRVLNSLYFTHGKQSYEKILKTLLNEYLIDLQKERKPKEEALLKALANFCEPNITGDETVPGQWEIPLGNDKNC
jgi:hypothetical protein